MSHNEYRDQLAYDIQVEYDREENGYPFVRGGEYDLADQYNLTTNCDFCNGKAEFDLSDRDNCKTCLKDLSDDLKLEFIKDEGEEYPEQTPEMKKWFDENVIPDSSDDEGNLLDNLPPLPEEAIKELNELLSLNPYRCSKKDCNEPIIDLGDKLCHSCYHSSCDKGECWCEQVKINR